MTTFQGDPTVSTTPGPAAPRPRLTVIVPVLGQGANTTAKTLRRGTDARVRHVFVDATTDGDPRGRVARAVERLPGSSLRSITERGQAAGARRAEAVGAALAELETDWFTVVDAGDFVVPGFHLRVLQAAEDLGAGLVGFSHTRVRGPVRVAEAEPDGVSGDVLVPAWRGLLGRGNRVGRLWAQLVHRSVLTELTGPWLEPRLHHGAGLQLGWRMHLAARSAATLRLPGYFRCNDFQTDTTASGHTTVAGDTTATTGDPALLGRVRAHQQVIDLARQHVQAELLVPEAVGAALRTLCRQARAEVDRGAQPGRQLNALAQEVVTGVGRAALTRAYRALEPSERRTVAALSPVA